MYINAIKEFGLYDKIWQAFAVFLPIKTVGVQGDCRTHAHVVGLRAITSADGMTADWYQVRTLCSVTLIVRVVDRCVRAMSMDTR